ncbi:MAG: ribosome assembly factor SBDS [Candidatus Korarchaeota archaeon]
MSGRSIPRLEGKRVDFSKVVVVRYRKKEKQFEIVVDPNPAFEYRMGKNIDLRDVMLGYNIYENARRGIQARPEDLIEVFGTEDVFKIADVILKEGEFKLTEEQRKELLEEKRKKIIEIISTTCVDPKTGAPHPAKRIEQAMSEAGVRLDPFRPPEEQIKEVVTQIATILPISMDNIKLKVVFPPLVAPRGRNILSRLGSIEKDEWGDDGSYTAYITIPAGIREKVVQAISNATKGKAIVNIEK